MQRQSGAQNPLLSRLHLILAAYDSDYRDGFASFVAQHFFILVLMCIIVDGPRKLLVAIMGRMREETRHKQIASL